MNPILHMLAWIAALADHGYKLRVAASQLLAVGGNVFADWPELDGAVMALIEAIGVADVFDECDPGRCAIMSRGKCALNHDNDLHAALALLDAQWYGQMARDSPETEAMVVRVLDLFNAERDLRRAELAKLEQQS